MNEAQNRLEAELAALLPQGASPELRRRIDTHRTQAKLAGSRWRLAVVLVGGLAAACVAAIFLQRDGTRRIDRVPAPVANRQTSTADREATTQFDQFAGIGLRPGAFAPESRSGLAPFSWPLENTLTTMITPDLLE
jgi:hypothetical protein